MSKKRIGIYGGAFDPFHYGHLKPVDEIYSFHSLDVIHFVPTSITSTDKVIHASQSDRLQMLKIGLENEAYIVDDREINRKGTSYTIDTVRSISKEYDNAVLYLIIGLDLISTIEKWRDFSEIIKLSNIIISSRMTENFNATLNNKLKSLISADLGIFHSESYGKIYIQETSLVDISSTEIRNRLKKNLKISNLVPKPLEKWLLEKKIY